jgi:GH15 family glucan-1,4-alpha-glucosidase
MVGAAESQSAAPTAQTLPNSQGGPVPIVARPALLDLAESSMALIESHQHPSGAYPACPDYPVYRFSWLRDGAFIADAMSRAGRPASATTFLDWCAGVIDARAGRIADLVARAGRGEPIGHDEFLPTRYTLDGGEGTEEWWNFQLDGYGTWLWALAAHHDRHGDPIAAYLPAVASTVDYLTAFGTRPCFDWWEEHPEQRHVSTLGAVAAGLRAAAAHGWLDPVRTARARAVADEFVALITSAGTHDGHLTKWLGGTAVDGSLLACVTPFGLIPEGSPVAERTYDEVRARLVGGSGGVHRYRGDTFYGGGEWLILTAWLGWYEARTGRAEAALSRLDWIAAQAADGLLPEQVSRATQQPEFIPQWTDRWGPVATPLLWSHAMFLTLAVECGVWRPSC